MARIVFDDENNTIYQTVVKGLNNGQYYGNTLTLGVFDKGDFLAGLIFHKENQNSVTVSIYSLSPLWATRKILKIITEEIAFGILAAKIITAFTSSKNKKAKDLLIRLGFKFRGSIKYGRADGSDEFIFQMEKKDFKFAR